VEELKQKNKFDFLKALMGGMRKKLEKDLHDLSELSDQYESGASQSKDDGCGDGRGRGSVSS